MRRGSYHIADEPRPGALAQYAIDPMWAALALMFGGVWLAWPVFALNAFALGSATRRRDLALLAAGLACMVAFLATVEFLAGLGWMPEATYPYLRIALTALKLTFAFVLQISQSRAAELHRYFGGRLRVAWPLIPLGFAGQMGLFKVLTGYWLAVLS